MRNAIAASLFFAGTTCVPLCVRADAVADANAGADALAAAQYAKAVQLFTKAIGSKKLSADDLESAYVERGKAYLGEHKDKLANADFDHALKLKPDDQEASALRVQGQGPAQPSAPAVSPAQHQFDTGKTLWQSGDCTGAEAQLRDGLALDPYNAAANYYYAECLIRRSDFAGASLPLRLAVQYGAGLPEGQRAEDEAKRLAGQYSPNGGIAMGCAVPVQPPAVDGAAAKREEILAAHDRLDIYVGASSRFQDCLQSGFTQMQAQVAARGGTYTGTALERKYQSAADKNQQEQRTASDQYEAALAAYNAAHPRR